MIQRADWEPLWDTEQMLPFTEGGDGSSPLCRLGQVECGPANGSCRVEISCLPFQKEKHTELYGERHSAFMSQHIDLENVSAEMFMAAYSFCLHFWDSSSVLGILLLLGSPFWTPQHPDTGRQQVPNPPTEATFWRVA